MSSVSPSPYVVANITSDNYWTLLVLVLPNFGVSKKKPNMKLTPVGFEPTQLALVELESTPLDHSGKVS